MNTSTQEKPIWEMEETLYNWKDVVNVRFDGNRQVVLPLMCAHCRSDMQRAQGSYGKNTDYVCQKCGNAIPQNEVDKIMMVFPRVP